VGGSGVVIIVGAITGIVLVWLLRRPIEADKVLPSDGVKTEINIRRSVWHTIVWGTVGAAYAALFVFLMLWTLGSTKNLRQREI